MVDDTEGWKGEGQVGRVGWRQRRRAGDYPLARVDVNVEPLYSASVTRRGDSLPRRKSSEVRAEDGDEELVEKRESRCGRWNKRGQRLAAVVRTGERIEESREREEDGR